MNIFTKNICFTQTHRWKFEKGKGKAVGATKTYTQCVQSDFGENSLSEFHDQH